MFISQVKKQHSKNSQVFYPYTLVQAKRVNGKVKQRSILYLGSDKLLRNFESRKKVMYVRKPSNPIEEAMQIYNAKGCKPSQLSVKKYVVYHKFCNQLLIRRVYLNRDKLG